MLNSAERILFTLSFLAHPPSPDAVAGLAHRLADRPQISAPSQLDLAAAIRLPDGRVGAFRPGANSRPPDQLAGGTPWPTESCHVGGQEIMLSPEDCNRMQQIYGLSTQEFMPTPYPPGTCLIDGVPTYMDSEDCINTTSRLGTIEALGATPDYRLISTAARGQARYGDLHAPPPEIPESVRNLYNLLCAGGIGLAAFLAYLIREANRCPYDDWNP